MTTDALPTGAGPAADLDDLADLQAELRDLRRLADEVLAGSWSVERYRTGLDGDGPVHDPALWDRVRAAGWPDVLVPEEAGGGGAGVQHLCVLAEAAGAAAAPVPLASAAAAAWCRGEVTGENTGDVTLVLDTPGGWSGGGVTGHWPLVAHGQVARRVLVLATAPDRSASAPAGTADGADLVLGIVDLDGPGVRRTPLRPLDRGPAAALDLDGAPLTVLATGPGAAARHQEAVLRAQLATVAELIGVAAAANRAATDYAKVRVAFGRPIGAFQAIKHRLVDERGVVEVARALVGRAAQAVDRDDPDRSALTSLAVVWAVDRLRQVPEGAGQVFGGIAYTWEHEAHVHLRRAATLAAGLGDRTAHRNTVVAWLRARHLD